MIYIDTSIVLAYLLVEDRRPADALWERALTGFPVAVRTLDALHLASIDFLRWWGQTVELATYDRQMMELVRAGRMSGEPAHEELWLLRWENLFQLREEWEILKIVIRDPASRTIGGIESVATIDVVSDHHRRSGLGVVDDGDNAPTLGTLASVMGCTSSDIIRCKIVGFLHNVV